MHSSAQKALHLPGQRSLNRIPDVSTAQLILQCQHSDVHIICVLDLVRKLPPPDLLPLGVIWLAEFEGHGDAPVHSFVQVMGPVKQSSNMIKGAASTKRDNSDLFGGNLSCRL